jgi:hypothetical protein
MRLLQRHGTKFQGALLRNKENQPRRNEEHEGSFFSFFVLFVSSWLILIGVSTCRNGRRPETMKIGGESSGGRKKEEE